MAASKTTYFSVEQNEMAKLAKALAHPARIAILQVLIKLDMCVCNEIVTQLPLAQATISQHLKVLKEVGLVKGEIAPNKSCYCIDKQAWQQAQTMFHGLFEQLNACQDDSCC